MRFHASSRILAALLASFAVIAPVTASLTQDVSQHLVTYQFDASTTHDAPDACLAWDSQFSVPIDGSTDGMLVPGDDPADHLVFDVPPALVGERLQVQVMEAVGAPNTDLMVYAPSCAGDIFTPPNIPFALPTPPLPATGESQLAPTNLASASWECNSSEWRFRLKQLGGAAAPQDIYVAWTDGSQGALPLTQSSEGNARYDTTTHLGVLPENAWTNMPSSWGGVFEILAGPCNATDAGAVFGDPPVLGDDVVFFTPVRSGPHVAQLTLGDPQAGPTSVPLSCHFCLGPGAEQAARYASYSLRVQRAT